MMRSAAKWLLILGLSSACIVVGFSLSRAGSGAHGYALYNASTRVVGTIVDGRTGQPIACARVFVLRCEDADDVDEQRREIQEALGDYGAGAEAYRTFGPVGYTDEEGRFSVCMRNTFCTAVGPGVVARRPPPFYAIGLIVVEKDGYVSTPFPTGHGTWRVLEQEAEDFAYAQIDLPTLRLPPSD